MKKIIFSIIIIFVALFLYGRYVEINNFEIKEYTLNGEKIADSFNDLKIVHFSDLLYVSETKEDYLKTLVKNINKENPDIIIFSGDLLKSEEKYNKKDYQILKKYLSKMEASLYKLAVMGDNDKKHLDNYKDVLYEADFKLLDNQNMLLFYKDEMPINIIGINDLGTIKELLQTDVETNYNLVITHEPDKLTKLSEYNLDVILSGHSLGGVINIPYYGGIIKKDEANTYINDYYKLDNTEIYISNGLGYEKYKFRLFNTPSINIYRFDK